MGGMKSCKMSKGRNASKEVANHWSAQFKNQLRNTKRLLHFSKRSANAQQLQTSTASEQDATF